MFENRQQFTQNKEFFLLPGNWGKVNQKEIIILLDSIVNLFYENLDINLITKKDVYVANSRNRPDPIKHGQIVKYAKYNIIYLNACGQNWYSFTYDFSHELCHHILDNNFYVQKFGWFEEAICALASIFVIDKMADMWRINPPCQNWKSYSNVLRSSLNNYLNKTKYKHHNDFNQWLSRNIKILYQDRNKYRKTNVVAQMLWPFFKQQPTLWTTIQYMKNNNITSGMTFNDYLSIWEVNVPDKYKSALSNFRHLLRTNEKPIRIQMRNSAAAAHPVTPSATPLSDLVKSFHKKTSSFEVFKSIIKELFWF